MTCHRCGRPKEFCPGPDCNRELAQPLPLTYLDRFEANTRKDFICLASYREIDAAIKDSEADSPWLAYEWWEWV